MGLAAGEGSPLPFLGPRRGYRENVGEGQGKVLWRWDLFLCISFLLRMYFPCP